jgi:hypothetical protein
MMLLHAISQVSNRDLGRRGFERGRWGLAYRACWDGLQCFATTLEAGMKRKTIEHYEIVRRLGAGGSGIAYLAQDTLL